MHIKRVWLLFVVSVFSLSAARAQFDTQSPYSYYGVGSLVGNTLQNGSAMGGVSQGLRDSVYVNYLNPASYSSIDVTQLIFGFELNSLSRVDNGVTYQNNNLFINQFGLALPIMHRHTFLNWGMYLGFSPYSQVNYKIQDTSTVYVGSDTLLATFNYKGTGGLNKITFGNSFQFGKHVSIGANVHYLFGSTERIRSMILPPDNGYLSTRVTEKTNVQDVSFDIGAQGYFYFPVKKYVTPRHITRKIKNSSGDSVAVDSIVPNHLRFYKKTPYQFVIGATYTWGHSFTAGFDEIGIQYLAASSTDIGVDTFLLNPSFKGNITMPHTISGGVSLTNPSIWTLAADFSYSTWSDFQYFDQPNLVYNNSFSAHLGFQYTPNYPDRLKSKRFVKNIAYRTGLRYFNRFYRPDGNPIDEFGISFGLGLPFGFEKIYDEDRGFKTILSYVNLSFEGGVANSRNSGLVNESFFRFGLSVTLRDKWFTKLKYN